MTKTQWDYTSLADSYVQRPDYAANAIDTIVRSAHLKSGDLFCDIGAGTGILTRALLNRNLSGVAIEPNDAMRGHGARSTPQVTWIDAVAEHTNQPDRHFNLVSFGSSLNVTDASLALAESARILKPGGWMACLWNHRDLTDPLQIEVEKIIHDQIPNYDYGTRRQDQTGIIDASKLFGPVLHFEGQITHTVFAESWIEAWRSHSTLERQAGAAFVNIVDQIRRTVERRGRKTVDVPYVTRVWMAPVAT